MVVDFQPAADLAKAIDDMQRAWARMPAAARAGLARFIWLREDGAFDVYRPSPMSLPELESEREAAEAAADPDHQAPDAGAETGGG